ncbi:hypothetical protein [Hymenobacter terrestris]|uniref:Uncharacterized protein n=1 Tax=Hymenobacter terrestris TaxID=2748310 RepID=A0ABX2Q5E5_9BACT|nr:hypothetical protein [Hymenobacter terrestris]NVO86180.1 hypothetical protein [Hymenobacter terrestris]
MKAFSLPLLATVALFAQCAKTAGPAPTPRVDYDQKSAEIVQALSPSVPGNWQLRGLYIKAQSYNTGQKELGLVRDTVFQDFATLSIQPAPSGRSIPDPRYASFSGLLHFRTKTYPVRFEVSASPDRLINDRGPQGTFVMKYNFPAGSHLTEPEEQYLTYLGFINENFSLDVVSGQPTMTWRGLSRGIDRIELVK